MANETKILLIYTGGTIGMVKDYESGALKAFDFDDLAKHIPELHQLGCEIDSISFDDPIDSSNMDVAHWVKIVSLIDAHYNDYDGFVVLHGSDTMSYTASAVSFMLENLGKPVIFTGSQLPIGDLRTDAKENLITSVQIAALKNRGRPVVQEVGLYFEYKLLRANRTSKLNAEHFEAFSSMNHPALITSGVHLRVHSEALLTVNRRRKFKAHVKMDAHVAVLKLFPGIGESIVNGVLGIPGLKAVVMETYGAGNAPTAEWMVGALKKAQAQGIFIANVTQCVGGSVIMGQYETSSHLKKLQLLNGKDITAEAALAKLMYLLGQGVSPEMMKSVFETPLRGEMQ
ncbi:asparaginase [Sediminicola luteus]|uniref:asparaginase n=1 Tax=Sediminicola luteus TaxID=319238 RepID=A0A2A4G3D3_9FLAO|nr:asparaginase [Sediminicola luteus]PCE63187.1 L-asparaginase 1 [Sediminicola luteus]